MSLHVAAIALSALTLAVMGLAYLRWRWPGTFVLGATCVLGIWGMVLWRERALGEKMAQLAELEHHASRMQHASHPEVASRLTAARERSRRAVQLRDDGDRRGAEDEAEEALGEFRVVFDLASAASRARALEARALKAGGERTWVDHLRIAEARERYTQLLRDGAAAFEDGRFRRSETAFIEALAQAAVAARINTEARDAAAEVADLRSIVEAQWSRAKPVQQAQARVLERYDEALVRYRKGEFEEARRRAREAVVASRADIEMNENALRAESALADWEALVEAVGPGIYVRLRDEWDRVVRRARRAGDFYRTHDFLAAAEGYEECLRRARPVFEQHDKAARAARELRASVKLSRNAQRLVGLHTALRRDLDAADAALRTGRFDDVAAPMARARVSAAELERRVAQQVRKAERALRGWRDAAARAPSVWYVGVADEAKAALQRGKDAQAAFDRGQFATAVALANTARAELVPVLARHDEARDGADRLRSQWQALAERALRSRVDIVDALGRADEADGAYARGAFELAARGYLEAYRTAQRALP